MSKLNILFEDNHIIVVVKPYNILSQGDITGDTSIMDEIKSYLKVKYNKPGAVYLGLIHRLDRPVGGIMVFAKTSKAASRLCKSFEGHDVSKKYLAIVDGKMDKDEDELIDYLERGKDGFSYVSSSGKKAVLSYKVLEYNDVYDCSLLVVQLKTGRHHQIRVQFSSRGHALLGDQRYGKKDYSQICLFAYSLSFPHPISKEIMEFEYFPKREGYWTRFTV